MSQKQTIYNPAMLYQDGKTYVLVDEQPILVSEGEAEVLSVTVSAPLEVAPYSPVPFSEDLVDQVRVWIGRPGLRWFRLLRHRHGKIPLAIGLNPKRKGMPAHPIHLREGMQIRNFLRKLPECAGWTYENLSDTWQAIVSAAVDREFGQTKRP